MTSSVKNRKFCYHSTLWREIHNFIILQCTSMVQFSIFNRIIFHLLKNDFLFVVVEHLVKGIGIMTLIRKSKPCVCIFFKFKPLFLWFFICSYKSFCRVTKFFSTIFFSRNVIETKPNISSATTVPAAKPGLTLNPLTGLPYTQKYVSSTRYFFKFCYYFVNS